MFKNRWINLAIIIFIAYAVITEQSKKQTLAPAKLEQNVPTLSTTPHDVKLSNPVISAHTANESSFVGRQVAKFINNTINTPEGQEAIKKIISATGMSHTIKVPKEFQEMNITDEKIGIGEEIACGQNVEIKYFTYSLDNKKILDQSLTTKIDVGSNNHHRGLELGIIGMKQGGVRKITMSPYLTNKHPNFYKPHVNPDEYTTAIVELVKSSPLPNNKGMRIFETKKGKGNMVLCGDNLKVNYAISDIKGNILYDSKAMTQSPVVVKLGSLNTPYVFNKALHYINQGGSKTILTPPNMYNNINNEKVNFVPASVKLPSSEMTILDVEVIE